MTSEAPQSTFLKIKKTFEAKVRRGLKKSVYETGAAPLIVGFSGGADSTALLLSLKSILPKSQHLCAVHIEHGLRGGLSKKDAEHTEHVCLRYDIDFRCEHIHVSRIAQMGLEGAARESRRSAFLAIAKEIGADTIALAHNRDDQAETVLMRLFEGAGVRGITGMKWRTPLSSKGEDGLHIIRPLLDLSRTEILAYLEAQDISWVEDETNEDENRLRNRIRKKIIPVIQDYIGDTAISGIAKSAEISAPLISLLDEMIKDLDAKFIHENDGKLIVFPLREVKELTQSLRVGLWSSVFNRLRDELLSHGRRHALRRWTRDLDRLAMGNKPSGVLSLPGGLVAKREYDRLFFGHFHCDSKRLEEKKLRVPGKTVHHSLGLAIEASCDFTHRPNGAWEACLDVEKLGVNACIRTRRDGDRFHPMGRTKAKKLKEYFIEKKIPRSLRNKIPLLAVGDRVAWIIGHQVSAEYMLHDKEKRGVTLKAFSEKDSAKPLSSLD
ncbi:MAG: tRNA lysidine(34) synthetase TilS [Nitrospinae bacterium]|nr:tRNA lysidine(34) synthetase TilS [Nitrospinota bacterium]